MKRDSPGGDELIRASANELVLVKTSSKSVPNIFERLPKRAADV